MLHSIDLDALLSGVHTIENYVYDLTREIAEVLARSARKHSIFAIFSELFSQSLQLGPHQMRNICKQSKTS